MTTIKDAYFVESRGPDGMWYEQDQYPSERDARGHFDYLITHHVGIRYRVIRRKIQEDEIVSGIQSDGKVVIT